MVFFSWTRPSPQEQKDCLTTLTGLNYDPKYKGVSANPVTSLKEDNELAKDGFFVNHARVLLGSGPETYDKGKLAIQNWRQYELNWLYVDPKTPIETGVKLCVCCKEFLPWLMLPVEIIFVKESKNSETGIASFCFGFGGLPGNVLGGEERFSIEMDENNQVWFEILSFSKPANFLSSITYPYVKFTQKAFGKQSTAAVFKHVNAS